MKIYSTQAECCGCGACVQICPRGCITMKKDEEGFDYPLVDEHKCIDCGLCKKTCNDVSACISSAWHKTYAAYNKDDNIRLQSSSGGLFHALSECIINDGGAVFGVVYDEKFRAVHTYTTSITGIHDMMGSKYTQSDTDKTFQKTKDLLSMGKKVLYSGTPCQIAGLKKFLGRDHENLISVSIICHGVPSPYIWQRSVKTVKGMMGDESLQRVSFRDKAEGWHILRILFEFDQHKYSKRLSDFFFFGGVPAKPFSKVVMSFM